MKLLILGATGRTGQALVKQALAKGHNVTVYVRSPNDLPSEAMLHVVIGQLTDQEKLIEALSDNEAVLVTLGNPKSNKSAPLFEVAMPVIISAMQQTGVKRLIKMSAMGVGQTYQNAPVHYRIAAKTFLKGAFRDHERGEQLLRSSELDWTTIHPGILVDRPKTVQPMMKFSKGKVKMPINSTTHRADVAQVILKVLTDKATYREAVLMCSKQ